MVLQNMVLCPLAVLFHAAKWDCLHWSMFSSSHKQKSIMSQETEVLVLTSLTRSLVILGLVLPHSVCLSAAKMT